MNAFHDGVDYSTFDIPTVREKDRGILSYLYLSDPLPFVPRSVAINSIISDRNCALIALRGTIEVGGKPILENPGQGIIIDSFDKCPISPSTDSLFLSLSEQPSSPNYPRPAASDIIPVEPSSLRPPFDIRRIYFITEVPPRAVRGGHSHHSQEVVLIALEGRLRIMLNEHDKSREFILDNPNKGLYITPDAIRTIRSDSPGTICLVLSSTDYDPSDYVISE